MFSLETIHSQISQSCCHLN